MLAWFSALKYVGIIVSIMSNIDTFVKTGVDDFVIKFDYKGKRYELTCHVEQK